MRRTNASGDIIYLSIYIRLLCLHSCRAVVPCLLVPALLYEGHQRPALPTQAVLAHDMVCRVWNLLRVNDFEPNFPLPPFWGHTRDSHVTPARHLPSSLCAGPPHPFDSHLPTDTPLTFPTHPFQTWPAVYTGSAVPLPVTQTLQGGGRCSNSQLPPTH